MIPAIAGVTACGKSDIAISLAKRLDGEIVSVDSAAVYQALNIGTATPSLQVQQSVPHHLINIIQPNESYSVRQFLHDAVVAVESIQKRGKTPILVGGSMMYFDILLHGLSAIPTISKNILQKIEQLHKDKGLPYLYEYLKKIDSESGLRIAPTDQQRICRALSVYEETGKTISEWTKVRQPAPFSINLLRLLPTNRDEMRQRMTKRLDTMWEDGLLEETKQASEKWQLTEKSPAMRMIGYKQSLAYLSGKIDIETMKLNAYYATTQFAKRQYTWLNRWSNFPCIDPLTEIEKTIVAYFDK